MHSPNTVVFESRLSRPQDFEQFGQFEWRQETISLAAKADRRVTQQICCQSYFLSTPVLLFQRVVIQDHLAQLAELCFFLIRTQRT